MSVHYEDDLVTLHHRGDGCPWYPDPYGVMPMTDWKAAHTEPRIDPAAHVDCRGLCVETRPADQLDLFGGAA